jgi:hypothetical protein
MAGFQFFSPGTAIWSLSQEDSRLQVPRIFLGKHLSLVRSRIIRVILRSVHNLDDTGCSDWEERKKYQRIVLLKHAEGPIHFGITRQIKKQKCPYVLTQPVKLFVL